MCCRCVIAIPPEELAKIIANIEARCTPPEPRYNVAPSQLVPVVRNAGGHNELAMMKWGLIPSWAKDAKIAAHTVNARCESVAEKPAFRHAISYNRCIVPVSGFYEWTHAGKTKQPYYIQLASRVPMCLAGIWETWKTPEGAQLETFSILTTTANSLIQPLHDRMPVILRPEDYSLWLSRHMHDPHALEQLYKPFPPDQMTSYKVSTLVNNVRNDSPACIDTV